MEPMIHHAWTAWSKVGLGGRLHSRDSDALNTVSHCLPVLLFTKVKLVQVYNWEVSISLCQGRRGAVQSYLNTHLTGASTEHFGDVTNTL